MSGSWLNVSTPLICLIICVVIVITWFVLIICYLQKLFRLTNLRKLTISENDIMRLPPMIANFSRLAELDISKNCELLNYMYIHTYIRTCTCTCTYTDIYIHVHVHGFIQELSGRGVWNSRRLCVGKLLWGVYMVQGFRGQLAFNSCKYKTLETTSEFRI